MASRQYRCDNCHLVIASEAELNPIRDLQERIEAGGVVPAGECPECGALAYLVGQQGLDCRSSVANADGVAAGSVLVVESAGGPACVFLPVWADRTAILK